MSDLNNIEVQRQMLKDVEGKGAGAKFKTWSRLCGPGWLQSAITLGGGSLAGSLYLGVIGGFELMWLQPLMMILGIVMLGAISYVTLSTGKRPFHAINHHINPVLGWSWAIATLMANMVWAMPQFSLGVAALEQNFGLAKLFGSGQAANWTCGLLLFAVATSIILMYGKGGNGVRIFEGVLKAMVAVVVVSFFLVVLVLTFGEGAGLPWGRIFSGFIPDLTLLNRPAEGLVPFIDASSNPEYWRETILGTQKDRMIAAAATAVGINMTFLLPYSMLKKKWDRQFRGLAVFDLATGLFIPFMLATSCVVIAAASQFHGKYDAGLLDPAQQTTMTATLEKGYKGNLTKRMEYDFPGGKEAYQALTDEEKTEAMTKLSKADRELAAMLVSRDASHLAGALDSLTGPVISQYVFGLGVVGMALSTIIILMLINGFTVCEMMGVASEGTPHRVGALLAGISGLLGFLFLWSNADAKFWLAVPTSIFGMALLPIAYITFFFMMNSRKLMGEHMPVGRNRMIWNSLMILAIIAASIGSLWAIYDKLGGKGLIGLGGFILLVVAGFFFKSNTPELLEDDGNDESVYG